MNHAGKPFLRKWNSYAVVVLLASAFNAGSICRAQEKEPLPPGEHLRTVRVGLYQNPPKLFTDESGLPAGIFVDLLGEIAKSENWKLVYVPNQWDECLKALDEKRIDLMPDVAHAPERDERYNYHQKPAVESWSQLYANRFSTAASLSDLNGRRIAVLKGASQNAVFQQMMDGFGFKVTLVQCGSFEDAFKLAASGSVDLVIANHFFGEYSIRKYGLVKTPIVFAPAPLFYVTRRGSNADLLESIDRHLSEWKTEPNSPYYKVLSRWMDRPSPRLLPRYIVWMFVVIVGALIFAAGFVFLLRRQVRARTADLVRLNELLRLNEETLKFQNLILSTQQATSMDGILVVDVDGKIVSSNQRFADMWGVPTDVLGTQSDDIVLQWVMDKLSNPEDFIRKVKHLYATPDEKSQEEVALKDGRMFERYSAPMIGADGKCFGRVWYFRDISERKRAEAERDKLEEQLRMSQKMEAIGSLAGGVAHDFNNLLSVILSYTDFAIKGAREGDPLREDLKEVKTAAERAAKLTHQLLAFGRKQLLQPMPLNLNRIAEGMEKMFRRVLREDIDFVQALSPDLGVVRVDQGQFEQVLMNLVVNARDAISEGGKIIIETSNVTIDDEYSANHVDVKPGPYVLLAVTDTGCGMDPQTQAKIFEPYFTTKEKDKGTGLGLSTVYGIIKQSGGNITVYSEMGQGSTFRIYLPRVIESSHVETKAAKVAARSTGTETILVVDDVEALRKAAEKALVSAGYRVLTAADGDDALRVSAGYAGDIHLLLTDMVMPHLGGKALAYEIKKSRPDIKVLYMSGYYDNAIVQNGLIDSETPFISKPFTSEGLPLKVREVLDGSGANHGAG